MSTNCRRDGELTQDDPPPIAMAHFDSFPKPIREALANANEDYSIYQIWWARENKRHDDDYIVLAIKGELS